LLRSLLAGFPPHGLPPRRPRLRAATAPVRQIASLLPAPGAFLTVSCRLLVGQRAFSPSSWSRLSRTRVPVPNPEPNRVRLAVVGRHQPEIGGCLNRISAELTPQRSSWLKMSIPTFSTHLCCSRIRALFCASPNTMSSSRSSSSPSSKRSAITRNSASLLARPCTSSMTSARTATDTRILAVARNLSAEGHDVVVVTKDVPMRVKASALGLHAEEYLAELATDSGFTGMSEVGLDDEQMSELYDSGSVVAEAVS